MIYMETEMATKTYRYDVVDHLRTPEDMALYLEMCLAENDDSLLAQALGDIARARGMGPLAAQTGLCRESLYRALSERGNPNLSTLHKVLAALGLKLTVTAA